MIQPGTDTGKVLRCQPTSRKRFTQGSGSGAGSTTSVVPRMYVRASRSRSATAPPPTTDQGRSASPSTDWSCSCRACSQLTAGHRPAAWPAPKKMHSQLVLSGPRGAFPGALHAYQAAGAPWSSHSPDSGSRTKHVGQSRRGARRWTRGARQAGRSQGAWQPGSVQWQTITSPNSATNQSHAAPCLPILLKYDTLGATLRFLLAGIVGILSR